MYNYDYYQFPCIFSGFVTKNSLPDLDPDLGGKMNTGTDPDPQP